MTGPGNDDSPFERAPPLAGWRVVTSRHERAPQMPTHGPSHATRDEALREACRRLEWQRAEDVQVVRIEGPDGEAVELAEIVRFCAEWSRS